ncbi:MAG: bifunctional adenosylcobinamide kinase/adenosylcobinamide-phosphate guanylyltransferase [Clostridiales bacterium]|jgi:adenosyl cobinamide kinase/adenosyl cobinamide phosphate guanylyltransferase|nr:bifunctional adenosylcobinamide kinase/adenosylcobinamide-phosphate guanylyltransferase [Clostridiales bacterium]
MVLIVGGEASGKAAYARSLGFADEDILYNLHEYIIAGNAPDLDELYKMRVITCNEVGCGIIPADKRERELRENIGRFCCKLAERAERVVRMTSGIPVTIKG